MIAVVVYSIGLLIALVVCAISAAVHLWRTRPTRLPLARVIGRLERHRRLEFHGRLANRR